MLASLFHDHTQDSTRWFNWNTVTLTLISRIDELREEPTASKSFTCQKKCLLSKAYAIHYWIFEKHEIPIQYFIALHPMSGSILIGIRSMRVSGSIWYALWLSCHGFHKDSEGFPTQLTNVAAMGDLFSQGLHSRGRAALPPFSPAQTSGVIPTT